jgi:hypothetical protein
MKDDTMAHPTGSEAAVSPAPVSVDEKAADFENFLFGDEEEAEEQDDETETDEELDADEADDDTEVDAEDDEDSDEQAEPAIEAPVSLNAEEKEVFAQLPPEAQQAWAASETRRNTQVQEATTKAKEAQRQAEQAAASADRQAETRYAEQLKAFTKAFEPQMPDPARYNDIQAYQRDKAIYDHAKAQFDQLEQQVSGIGVETPEQKAERIKARDAELLKIPEIANEETRDAYIKGAFEVAVVLGYNQAELAEHMDANDLKALGLAAQWKKDSAELARIKAKSLERRRDASTGKFKALKPGAAPQASSRVAKASKAFERVKQSGKNRDARDAATAEWLEAAGHL